MKNPWEWEEIDIQEMIDNQIQEDISLDYKACPALGRTDTAMLNVN
jgi:hypothetical protein